MLIARRFHNDAVRDTLALRTRRTGAVAAPRRHRAAADVLRDRRARGIRRCPLGRCADTERSTVAPSPPGRPCAQRGVVLLDDAGPGAAAARARPDDPRGAFLVHRRWRASNRGRACAMRRSARSPRKPDFTSTRIRCSGRMWRRVAIFPFNGELIRIRGTVLRRAGTARSNPERTDSPTSNAG